MDFEKNCFSGLSWRGQRNYRVVLCQNPGSCLFVLKLATAYFLSVSLKFEYLHDLLQGKIGTESKLPSFGTRLLEKTGYLYMRTRIRKGIDSQVFNH